MEDLITVVHAYATARAGAERHRALLECLVDDNDGFFMTKIAEYELASTTQAAASAA